MSLLTGGSGSSGRGDNVNENVIGLIASSLVAVLAAILILRRQRHDREDATAERPFAVSTEGEKRCPKCGMGNLWTDTTCIACGANLPG